jgi:dolichyl-phosphate-mannose-protein mannosyltransferase
VPDRVRIAALLAIPYLVTAAALRGLTQQMPTYHGGDETTYHLPTIAGFAHQIPGVDLVHYPAAQTPLFHLLVAAWARVVGFELWRLRILELVVSYLVVLLLYRVLRRYAGLDVRPAALLAGLFGCSPYVFGQSFILVTDNLGLLLALLAIERLLAFERGRGLGSFAAACGWIGLALLTRQSYVWLGLLALAMLLVHASSGRVCLAGLACLGLASLPFAALLLAWHGFVPPTADPASCGLCAPEAGRLGWAGRSPLVAPLFALAVAGVYGPLLHGRALLGALRAGGGWALPALAAAGGAGLLVLVPLAHQTGDEGWIWRIGRIGLVPGGTAWPFWLLVPAGLATVVVAARRAGPRSLPALLLGSFLVVQLATRLPYQKYFDPFVLLAFLLMIRPEQTRTRADALGPALIGLMSLGYVLAFVLGLISYQA